MNTTKIIMNLKAFKDKIRGKVRTDPYNRELESLIFKFAKNKRALQDLTNLQASHFLEFAFSISSKTQSQIFQDAFVLYILDSKEKGFYCEFGATNGYNLSNSHALETYFSWDGICAEPAKNWQSDLVKNRAKARIETDCVWSTTGEVLLFSECNTKELSTLTSFTTSDGHSRRRKKSQEYEVKTISLNDLLEKHNAPENFDYLSMDTEGSELEILQAFDINKWQPKIITVEHNYTENRLHILNLLEKAGYTRVLTDVSCFDDWYLAPEIELPEVKS